MGKAQDLLERILLDRDREFDFEDDESAMLNLIGTRQELEQQLRQVASICQEMFESYRECE